MNMKWMIIGGVAVMLLIAFGRNPIDEARKERAEAMKGKDKLIMSIEEHTKKAGPRSLRTGSAGFRGNSGGAWGNHTQPAPTQTYPGYMMKNPNQNPYGQAAPALQPQPQPPQNSYYPPPPQPQGQVQPLPPRSSNERYLPNGQKLIYAGSEVYTLDTEGRQVPLADGVYPMDDRGIVMIVQGGRKIIN